MSPEQQALLKQRLNKQKTSQPWTIPKRGEIAEQDRLAVSFGQQRMWFQDQLGTQSAASNNISIFLKISGDLDVNALERSLAEILNRHEVLRTTFQTIAGELIQIIHPVGNWYIPFIDLRSLDPLERELEIERIARSQARQTFNLATDVLLRSSLLKGQMLAADLAYWQQKLHGRTSPAFTERIAAATSVESECC